VVVPWQGSVPSVESVEEEVASLIAGVVGLLGGAATTDPMPVNSREAGRQQKAKRMTKNVVAAMFGMLLTRSRR
jgi:hypothetical protein